MASPAPGPKNSEHSENLLKVLKNLLGKNEGGKFARPSELFPKKITWAILRQAIEGSKFDEQKICKFPPH